jgi:hypothetical protein
MAELCLGAKCRVPYRGEMVVATIIEISRIPLPNGEQGWAIHLVADPPCQPVSLGFPVRGDLETVSIAKTEEIFEQQLQRSLAGAGQPRRVGPNWKMAQLDGEPLSPDSQQEE